jgi:nucleoid-associated protein YgaU
MNSDTHELKTKEEKSNGMIIPVEHQNDRVVNKGHVTTHKIVANDNLYDLAKTYYNDESKWITIYEANKNIMSDPHSLKIGQELLIPDASVSI